MSEEKIDENMLIPLKEASKITGYSADYIGQLIRNGKISGKQVYSNVAWMTTVKAVREYKKKGSNKTADTISDRLTSKKRKVEMEMNVIKLFFQTFKKALPLLLTIYVTFMIISYFVLNNYLSNKYFNLYQNTNKEETKILNF